MTQDRLGDWVDQDTGAQLWVEPSREARFLLRAMPWLVSPGESDSAAARIVRNALVAPFTQLTFFSFDLQAYLFELFHDSRRARAGHAVGMAGAVTCLLALGCWAWGPTALLVGCAALITWYVAVAAKAELALWGVLAVPMVLGLGWVAAQLAGAVGGRPGLLWAGWLGSGIVIALSHSGELMQPPRAFDPTGWSRVRTYLVGEGERVRPLPVRLAYMGWVFVTGVANELWASPRLLPYNLLFLMFRGGYAPRRAAQLTERTQRAWASGNPALDFVGEGGAAYLRLPEHR